MGYRSGVAGDERRVASRYASRGTPVLIGWLDGEHCRTVPGTLQDVSLSGAKVVADAAPPPTTPVRVRLAFGGFTETVKAEVVGVALVRESRGWFARGRTANLIRLRFAGACPYEFFKAAVAGFVVESHSTGFEGEGFDARDWR